MKKLLTFLFLFVFVLITIAFLGALLSTIISPKLAWPLAFLGLGYPFLLGAILFYFLVWLFQRNKKMIYPMILLLIAAVALPNALNFLPRKNVTNFSAKPIKVMSYNVRNFEVYDNENGVANRDKIVKLIKEEKPDILCLQEAHNRTDYLKLSEFSKEMGLPYYHFEVGVYAKSGEFGVATFSKYPILDKKSYQFSSGGNVGSRVDFDMDKGKVSVFNIHLESANIEDKYYNYGNSELEDISKKKLASRAKRVVMQLKRAYTNRASQAELIRKEINSTENAIIVCGDFNDPAVSYSYTKVKGGLQDTFKKGKIGIGSTFPKIPFLRIDHIFASKHFNVLDYNIKKEKYSDHYPVITLLEIK